jgi:nicotinamidase-related amidase
VITQHESKAVNKKEVIMAIPKPTKEEDYMPDIIFTVEPMSTALILIDLQYATACRTMGLGKKMINEKREHIVKWRFDRIEQVLLPNVKRLLSFFRKHKMKVVYITFGSTMPDYSDARPTLRVRLKANNNRAGTREHEILDEIKPIDGEYVVNKTTISAFWSSGINNILNAIEAKYLLFAGVSTNMCVEGTARDASEIGDYRCVMLEDCLATTHEELHRATIRNFQRLYGRVVSTEEILEELRRGL